MNALVRRLTLRASTRHELLVALVAAALFSVESWALGPYSWMYGYGAGLETIPTHLALSMEGRNFSSWAPFIVVSRDWATGKIDRGSESPWPLSRYFEEYRRALRLKNEGKDVFAYRLSTQQARYRFASRAVVRNSGREVLDPMSGAGASELRDTVFVESDRDIPSIDRLEFTTGQVLAATPTADGVRLKIRSPGEGLLLIASNWSPY